MKKFGKILSSVLAASMALSCLAMNVMAASKAHTVTITPSKTTGLVAGETIVVELTVDNTLNLNAFQYDLNYDTTAFEVDTEKVSRVEKCIDKAWLDGIKDTDGDWGYYLGAPVYNVGTPGKIAFQWAGSAGVEAEYAQDNRVVGKFNIIVKADAPDGDYTFTLTNCKSTDIGENSGAAITCAPVTVKVGEDAPAETETTVYYTVKAQNVTDTNATGVNFTIKTEDPAVTGTNSYVKEAPFAGLTIEAGEVTVALAIENILASVAEQYVTVTAELY